MKKKGFVASCDANTLHKQSIKMALCARFHKEYSNKQRFLKIMLSFFLLTMGGLIYIGYREQSLVMFDWAYSLGLSEDVANFREIAKYHNLTDWVKNSLPDGLWLFAYMFCTDAIWNGEKSKVSYIFIFVIPFLALLSEFLQYIGIISGVFDWIDVCSYIVAVLLFFIIKII